MTIERAVQFIKGGFSFQAGKELGIRSPVWQKGFSEVRITHPEGFLQVRTYIHNNPAMRHLIVEPRDYRTHRRIRGSNLIHLLSGKRQTSNVSLNDEPACAGRRFDPSFERTAAEAC